jgi:hypothetical protein
VTASQRCPKRAHSAAALDAGFSSPLGRLRAHSNVVESRQPTAGPSTDAMGCERTSRRRYSGQQPGNAPEIAEGSTLPDRREVIMIMSEYEERFRSPAPSLHQTFAATRGPNRGRRSRRLWVAAALVGVMTMTCKVASHHAVHTGTGNGSEGWESSVR